MTTRSERFSPRMPRASRWRRRSKRLTHASRSITIRRSSSRFAQSPRPWRSRNACRRQGPRAGPSMAFRLSSKTISMSPGFPRQRLVPPSPITPKNPRSSSRGLKGRARSSSARPISTSLRPASSASVRPMGFHATRCARISYPEDRAPARRPRSARASSRFRLALTRRDRGGCRPRSTESSG